MAQTKPKAGQFYGVSNNGTDGEFLQTDGVGGMAWAATRVDPTITSIDYSGSTTAADPAGGETVLIVGTGFLSGATVLIGSVAAPSVTVTSSAVLTITTPAGTAGTHSVTVNNVDGGSVIQSAFFQYDGVPIWTTAAGGLGSVTEGTAASFQVTATEGSDTIEYAVTTGSLPVGLSLATATGAITGTAPAVSGATTTTFSITATDDENQTSASRSFSIIVSPVCTTNTVQIFGMDTVNEVTPSGFTGGVALYQLNGDANDVSGNYNGTASGVTYGSGIISECGIFSTSGYINTAADFDGSTVSGSSISLWFKTDSSQASCIITGSQTVQGSASVGSAIWLGSQTGTFTDESIGFWDYNSGTTAVFLNRQGTTAYMDNTWHHLVITSTSTVKKMYVDNVEQTLYYTASGSQTQNAKLTDIKIGASIGVSVNPVQNIDQVRLFSTAISAANIATLYNEGVAKALYQLNWDGSDLGNNYNGTASNVTFSAGKFNNGGSFNGSSSQIVASSLNYNTLPTNNAWSVSCWLKPAASTGSAPISLMNSGSPYSGFAIFLAANVIQVAFNGSTPVAATGSFLTYTADTWVNVILTYDGSSTSTIYYDGAFGATISQSIAASTTGQFKIGTANVWGYYDGSIDQVRVFGKELNSTEVTTLYNEVLCTPQCTTNTTNYPTGVTNTAYYKLDGNANDVTTVYNASQIGITWTNQGRFGNAAGYAGGTALNGSQVSVSNSIYGASKSIFSISFWVKCTNTTGEIPLAGNGGTIGGTTGYAIYLNSGKLYLTFVTSGSASYHGNTEFINDDNWHNIVLTFNNGPFVLYLDGVSYVAGTSTYFTGNPTPSFDTFFGNRWNRNESGVLNGAMDQIRVFGGTILNQANVTDLYNEVEC